MFPMFFSVASTDVSFAEKVWAAFPEDTAYLYSKTGEYGAHMWDEISESELPKSRLFVVFWSKNFINATGCIKEISQARDMVRLQALRPLILRLDDFPISWNASLGDEIRPVFDALSAMLDFRTSGPNVTVREAIELVQRVSEAVLRSDHPRLPRLDLQKTFRETVVRDKFTKYPAVWVSGFNGVGRESVVRDFALNFAPNGRAIVVEVNEASLPKQILLRIESEAFGADHRRLLRLNAAAYNDEPRAVAAVIDRVFNAGNYVILRHSRIVEENVELPEWLDDVVNALSPAGRPKLFIISQLPLRPERRTQCREAMVAQRVPTIDHHQMTEFAYELIAHFDQDPGRWRGEDVERAVNASGGNIGFLVSIVRSSARIEDFDHIKQIIAADSEKMTESITVYVRWAFMQLRDLEDEQRALLFLNDISPCDFIDLERAITPKRAMPHVLGKLLDLGLIERESGGLYRLTPLLGARLSRDLVRPELVSWARRTFATFIQKPFELEGDQHEYLRIESRIKAAILTEAEDIPNNVREFVSAAHWFQAGVRLYHARRREPAYRILKKAYLKRHEFRDSSRIELIRYFCLSAIQNRQHEEAEACITLLDSAFQTKDMAAFLRAAMFEYQRKFPAAIQQYQLSLQLNEGKSTRIERTYRPLVKCILATHAPDFSLAEKYALAWIKLRRTVFSLKALADVYLRWWLRGGGGSGALLSDIKERYKRAVHDLEIHPGVGSAYFEIKSEEAALIGDYHDAIEWLDGAIYEDPRFELRVDRWRLMARSGDIKLAQRALYEMDTAKTNKEYRSNWVPFLPSLTEAYVIALRCTNKPIGLVNAFAPELPGDEIGSIIGRSSKST